MQIQGSWYALMNRQARKTRTDSVVLRPMTPREVEAYHSMKQSGFVEAAIFAQLYPPNSETTPAQEVVVPITLLNKSQLVYLIENRLRAPLPSLAKMDKKDLVMMLGRL